MTETFWLLVTAGGPLILAIIFAYVLIRRRKLSRAEFEAGERETRRLYEERDPEANGRR